MENELIFLVLTFMNGAVKIFCTALLAEHLCIQSRTKICELGIAHAEEVTNLRHLELGLYEQTHTVFLRTQLGTVVHDRIEIRGMFFNQRGKCVPVAHGRENVAGRMGGHIMQLGHNGGSNDEFLLLGNAAVGFFFCLPRSHAPQAVRAATAAL